MIIPKSLEWRWAIIYTILILVTMVGLSVYLITLVQSDSKSILENQLQRQASLIGQALEPDLSQQNQLLDKRVKALSKASKIEIALINTDAEIVALSSNKANFQMTNFEIRQALENKTQFYEIEIDAKDEESYLYLTAPIQVDGKIFGVLRIGVQNPSKDNEINSIILAVMLSALLVIIISLLFVYNIAHTASDVIKAFTQGAKELSKGNLSYEVPVFRGREARGFATSFNRMARNMRSNVSALESERSTLSAVLETMNDGVIVADAEGKITLINPAAQKLLDITQGVEESVTGTSTAKTLGYLWDHELRNMILNTVKSSAAHNQDILLQPEKTVVNAISTPINHLGTKAALLTLRNIAEYQNIENTRREFVTNVSHELRSPLTSVKALIETLINGAMDDKKVSEDYLLRINTDIDRMNELVGELLELSTLERGIVHIDISKINIHELIGNVVNSLDYKAKGKNIEINYPDQSTKVEVLADKHKIIQVLINLLDNSIRFTPNGGNITVSTAQLEDLVEISVMDNGTGISDEDQKHIFERFYKVDPSRSSSGTGLGLAIAKHIIMAHDGNITVSSQPGSGSTFSFQLQKN